MTRYLLLYPIVLTVILATTLFGQAPDTLWTRLYGADYSEVPFAGTMTSDGNFVITGYTSSFGAWQCDGYFVKIDMNGDTIWTSRHGEDYYDYAMDIVETPDSGLVMAGKHSFPGSGIRKAWLLKLASDGSKVWEKNFISTDDLETEGLCITADSGFAVTGYTGALGSHDIFLLRTDKNGDSLWLKTYGGIEDDEGILVEQTPDSGFFIVNRSESFGAGDWDLVILRTDKNGDSLWVKRYGGTEDEGIPSLARSREGGFIIASSTFHAGLTDWPVWLLRMNDDGDTLWTKEVDGQLSITPRAICETADSGFIITGSANYGHPYASEVYVVRTDPGGDTLWTVHHGGNAHDRGIFVSELPTGELIVGAGYATSSPNPEYYALKFAAPLVGVDDRDGGRVVHEFRLSQNYPNPFNPGTAIRYEVPEESYVTLRLYNVAGAMVATLVDARVEPGSYSEYFDGAELPSGVYYYRLTASGRSGIFTESNKMILLR